MPTPKTKPTVESNAPIPSQPAAEPAPVKITYSAALFTNDDSEDFELTADQYEKLKAHLVTLTAPVTSDQQFKASMKAADDRAKVINNVLGRLDGHRLEQLETVRLMSSRTFCGIDDPMSKFICDLIFHYGRCEADGSGMTIDLVEDKLAELRENMDEAISEARFISSRYPRPEASDAKQ